MNACQKLKNGDERSRIKEMTFPNFFDLILLTLTFSISK